eukprot:4222146-Prymnesium_polylepis.1
MARPLERVRRAHLHRRPLLGGCLRFALLGELLLALLGVLPVDLDVLLHRREQPVAVDRLGDVVGHAGGEALLLVAGHRVRRQRDDREVVLRRLLREDLADPASRLVAVHDGHVAIHQDEVVRLLGRVRRLP